MEIDPVVLLAEELRATETALRAAIQRYERDHARESGEKVNSLLNAIKSLYRDLFETAPTSALGAAEMLRMAAQRLPFSMARYSSHFHEVADRLGAGRRDHADLVWLRAMRGSLQDGQGGDQGTRAAPLVALALAGAARPVLVFRAMVPPPRDEPMRLPRR
jgi:hypothetical protein